MLTMTSLAAQSQFGNLIDRALRQPVAVTRRGRPVAVVQSYEDYVSQTSSISPAVARWISKNYPLEGAAAAQAMRQQLETMGDQAHQDGLSEADVMRMLHDN